MLTRARVALAAVLVAVVCPRIASAQEPEPEDVPVDPAPEEVPVEAPEPGAPGEETPPGEEIVPEDDVVPEDVIEVEGEPDRAGIEAATLARRKSAAAQDSVGRAEIARTPDRNAADAARRVVGTTIIGGRFVFVRGLGERYTNALLDGAPLPSPEPDRQAVPLDLFPTQVIDSITIVKTFTPDVPGDFAGGSVRIATRRLPDQPVLSLSLGLGANTNATFAERLDYEGGGLDWLGFDDGTRALPEEVPDYAVLRGGERPDQSIISREETTAIGRAMNSDMSATRTQSPPNHNGALVAGKTFELGGDQKLGVMSALTYSRSFERRAFETLRTFNLPGGRGADLAPLNDLQAEKGTDRVAWGGLVGLTYEPHGDHRLSATFLYSRAADDETTELEGFHEERSANIHETRLSFVERSLTFLQLRGEHLVRKTWGTEIDWNASVGRAVRDEPDTRGTVFQFDEGTGFVFEDDASSGSHFYSEQGETSFGGGVDVRQPLQKKENPEDAFAVKLGGRGDVRDRSFEARRFRFRPVPNGDPQNLVCPVQSWDPECPARLLRGDRIGPVFELEENTRPTDAYDADASVAAGYVMIDGPLMKGVRVLLGERLEVSHQGIASFSPLLPDTQVESELDAAELLPAAALVLTPRDDMAIRFSATRTLARPQLRELAPFSFADYFGGRETQGNPDLGITRIVNLDARIEMFPSLREVLAATAFFKSFEDPIEATVLEGGARGIVTYQNAPGAILGGVELEARKELGFITESLKILSVVGNVTLAHSRVTLDDGASSIVTNLNRPLSNQSPWVVNAAIDLDEKDWGTSARLSYNVAGPRIVQVGTDGLPDLYEQARHQVDVAVAQRFFRDHLELKATLANLFDDDFVRTQGEEETEDNVTQSYSLGQTFGLSATLSL